jgi:hypothetical protein
MRIEVLLVEFADPAHTPGANRVDHIGELLSEFGERIRCAPFHQRSADELVRVTKPGGRIGLINWTPEGHIGQLFATMKPHMPAPPPGAQPPPLWGREDHVRALFGSRVTDVVTERRTLTVDHFPDGAAFRDYFKAVYGPTIAAYRNIEADPDRVAELDAAIARLGDGVLHRGSTMEWEYLLLMARKA